MSLVLLGALAAATAAIAATLAVSGVPSAGPAISPRHPDAEVLRDAGWAHGLARWEALRLAVVATAALAASIAGLPAVMAVALAVVPSLWARARAEALRQRSRRAYVVVLASIASALRSGLALPDAIRRATEDAGAERSTRSLRAALRAFDLGSGLDESLLGAGARAHDPAEQVALGTLAVGVAERLPRERLAGLVEAVADRTGFALRLEDEVHARSAGARQQQKLLALIVPALALYLCLTMPSLASTLASDLGRYVLIPGAAMLELGGIVLGGRIVRGAAR